MINVSMTVNEIRAIMFALALEHETLVEHLESEPDDKKALGDLRLIEQVAPKLHSVIDKQGI